MLNILFIFLNKFFKEKKQFFYTVINVSIGLIVFIFIMLFAINSYKLTVEDLRTKGNFRLIYVYSHELSLDNVDLFNIMKEEKVKEYKTVYDSNEYVNTLLGENVEDLFFNVMPYSGEFVLEAENNSDYLIKGRLPENDNEIIIIQSLENFIDIDYEEILNTIVITSRQEYSVCGVISDKVFQTEITEKSYDIFMRKANLTDVINGITIELENNKDILSIVEQFEDLGYYTENNYKEYKLIFNSYMLIISMSMFLAILLLLIFSFNLKSTIEISFRKRVKFFSLLKTLGYTDNQCKKFIMLESAVICIISYIITILLAILISIAIQFVDISILGFNLIDIFRINLFVYLLSFIGVVILINIYNFNTYRLVDRFDVIRGLKA